MAVVNIRRDNDPFKKYWWVILAGFGVMALWVCFPAGGGTGSGSVARGGGLKPSEQGLQSLDSRENAAGAPGSVVDLSMEGAGGSRKKQADGDMASSLYQAPGAAPGAPIEPQALTAASVSNLAAALKKASKSDPSGWGGAKAQRGFTAPKANFGGLSGFGSGSGGTGAAAGASAFNTQNAKVGFDSTRGLSGDGSGAADGNVKRHMRAVTAAARASFNAAGAGSGDAMRGGAGTSFDGSGAGAAIAGKSGSHSAVYGRMDDTMAPANLKGGPPDAKDKKKDPMDKLAQAIEDMNDKGEEKKTDPAEAMTQRIQEMIIMAVVGGVVNGVVGGMMKALLPEGWTDSATKK